VSYGQTLGFLERALDARAISGEDAVTTLMEAKAEREQRIAERRQMKQEARATALTDQREALMGSQGALFKELSTLVQGAPQDTSLEDLQAQITAASTLAGVPLARPQAKRLQGAIGALYQGRNFSPLYTQESTDFDMTEQTGLQVDIDKMIAQGKGKQQVFRDMMDLYRQYNGAAAAASRRDSLLNLITERFGETGA
jgi:hypothetical protein